MTYIWYMVVWIVKWEELQNSWFHVGSNLGCIGSTCDLLRKADYKIYVDGNKHHTTSFQKKREKKHQNWNWQETCKIELKNFWSGKVFI